MKICIELPDELAEWLKLLSKQIGMRQDDFIASVLYRYYDVWNLGREFEREAKEEGRS